MAHLNLLQQVYLFDHLSTDELEIIFKMIHWVDVPQSDYVFREGEKATSMYIVKTGLVEVLKKSVHGEDQHVAKLEESTHFGEMAFLDQADRAAGVRALENVKLIEIKYKDLDQLINTQPAIGMQLYKNFAQTLCRRIRSTTTDLTLMKDLHLKHL